MKWSSGGFEHVPGFVYVFLHKILRLITGTVKEYVEGDFLIICLD